MKGSRNQNSGQSKQEIANKPKPEIRDNLDSRKEKEGGHFTDRNNKAGKKPNSRDRDKNGS